jgi:hypothetical protein
MKGALEAITNIGRHSTPLKVSLLHQRQEVITYHSMARPKVAYGGQVPATILDKQ